MNGQESYCSCSNCQSCSKDVYKKGLDVLLHTLQSPGSSQQKLALPTNEGLLFVEVKEIIYCQAEDFLYNNMTC